MRTSMRYGPPLASPRPMARADFGRLLHALAGDSERAGQAHVVDERLVEIHADVEIVLGREALQREGPLLEDAVRGVVEDHVDDRQRLAGGGPQALARVHRAAVADHRDDRAIGQRELDADRRRQAPADAAAAQAEEALGILAPEEVTHTGG